MTTTHLLFILLGLLFIVCWIYVGLIDHMNKYHKDYEGEDFLPEEKPKKK